MEYPHGGRSIRDGKCFLIGKSIFNFHLWIGDDLNGIPSLIIPLSLLAGSAQVDY